MVVLPAVTLVAPLSTASVADAMLRRVKHVLAARAAIDATAEVAA